MGFDMSREKETRPGDVARFIEEGFQQATQELRRLVGIPSVSSDPSHSPHVEESAEVIASLAKELNIFDYVEISCTSLPGGVGAPAVIARREPRNGRATVLLYAHHDVQPVQKDHWGTDPFVPEERNGRLLGRGAADDKAGVLIHLESLRALGELSGDDLDLGIVLFIEGEEESGSASLTATLAERAELGSDVVIVSDSDNWDDDTPGLTASLRGSVIFTLDVDVLERPVHSGLYGGAAPDAIMVAATLIASLYGADGSVAVSGLHSTSPPSVDIREELFRQEAGVLEGVGLVGSGRLSSRLWKQPSITVIGMTVPSVASASTVLTPSVSLSISLRVAPGQEPTDAFDCIRSHLLQHNTFGARLTFSDLRLGHGHESKPGGRAAHVMRQSLLSAWGAEAADIGIGGSIPFVAAYKEQFPEAEILITGVCDAQTNAHGHDESVSLLSLKRMINAQAYFLTELNQQLW
ncbi:M20/M25/M40 family metallo-hydrolase [Paenarthrobacter nicotinovorans]|jgi:acetylornithine deacetylase/succinyl-diaminopimelate desuccinylase-like protein|nr:M20/M25/M40 family metallo-hydrolase [Paenarthrobacter nicotinovorans]